MTLLTNRGAGTPTTTGTTWATVTNAVDGTPPANPATYATWTSSTSGAVATIEITGYAFSATIGAGDTLTSVSVSVRHLVSNVARYASITYQAFSGGVAIGSPTAATLTTAAHNDTATIAVTLAQLRAATFAVRVTATRAAVTQSAVWSVDHVDVTADYSPPGVARDLAGRAGTAVSAAATTLARSRPFSGRADTAVSGFAALTVTAAPALEGFRVARALAARAGTSSSARGDLTTTPAVGAPPEGFRVARALLARAGTATGARGTLVTTAPDITDLAGATQTATSARAALRAARPLAARAGTATSARATLTTAAPSIVTFTGRANTATGARGPVLVTRRYTARAPTATDATASLTVYAGALPGGPLAIFRQRVASILDGIDPATAPDVFAVFRSQVTDALAGAVGDDTFTSLREAVAMTLDLDTVFEVHAGPIDSLTPPAYMLEWADPWTEPGTHCYDDARLEVLCVVSRVDPTAALETLEFMVAAAVTALAAAGIAHGPTSAPRPFDIGGVDYLAARIQVHQLVNVGA